MKLFKPRAKQTTFFELLKGVSEDLKGIAALFAEFTHNFKNTEEYSKKAKELEHKADQKTHEIVDRLNKTFITPFDREDIYLLANELDDVIDLIEDVIHNIHLYGITEKIKAIDDFAALMSEGSLYIVELMDCIKHQKHTPQLMSIKIKLHELEDKGDAVFEQAISSLFSQTKDPIAIIKLKDILEGLENIIDKYQKVSDIVEGLMVKSS